MGARRGKREVSPPSSAGRWYRSAFGCGLAGGVLLWSAFPPLGLAWLGWLAPLPWLACIQPSTLTGRRPYWQLWLAGTLFWICLLEGIRKAHVANTFGLLALSMYLGVYLPLFIGLSRVAVHRLRWPLTVAAPVVWTGLELLRGHVLTGFSMGALAHTQVDRVRLIQIADLGGAYAVSFLMMLVAACGALVLVHGRSRRAAGPLAIGTAALALTLVYGSVRLSQPSTDPALPQLKVALVQCNFNTYFEFDPYRNRQTFDAYWQRTRDAVGTHPDLDVIVWPESVFTDSVPELLVEPGVEPPPDVDRARVEETVARFQEKARQAVEILNEEAGRSGPSAIHLLVGTESYVLSDPPRQHNSALLIAPDGRVVDRYYKMHPVMFGEYIPLGNWFPWIYRLTPLGQGLTPGERPAAFELGGLRLAPSICFESSVPHLIRRQVRRLERAGEAPHALVNVTHDGWFWGAAILDLQLAGAVFRAVETRRPVLVAANAGISAVIDGNGRQRERGPRQGAATLVSRVSADPRRSGYLAWGDLPAALCLLACGVLAVAGAAARRRVAAEPPPAARSRPASSAHSA